MHQYFNTRANVAKCCLVALLAFSMGKCIAQTQQRPWLLPAKPTVLEWVIFELQVNGRDSDFGDDQVTIEYHIGPGSAKEGKIYCQIRYLPAASAELVQQIERNIREQFEYTKQTHPWAKLEIRTEVARLKK